MQSQGRSDMGTIRKRNGKFQAQIRRDGVPPLSKTFLMKKDAAVWVRGIEARIDGRHGRLYSITRKVMENNIYILQIVTQFTALFLSIKL